MPLSLLINSVPFLGRKKQKGERFWGLAQDQTRFLYNVAFKYTGNRYDAEDLVQETLYTAFHKFHQLRDNTKFKSWAFKILRNQFLKMQRKRAPITEKDYEDGVDYMSQLASVSSQIDVAVALEQKLEAEAVQTILNKLPEKHKAVLILYYMEDSSYQEIAEMLEVPIGTVMSRLSRAKQLMKKAVIRSGIKESHPNVVRLKVKR